MDPRRQRSFDAIQRVFFGMVLTRRYHEITIAEIINGAGVARSTFYEIFPNKDALLASALAGPFAILARSVDVKGDVVRTQALLEHFWENRGMARGLFTGAARPKLVATLAAQIDAQLLETRARLSISRPLAATALAELLLGTIATWSLGRAPGDSASLARGLHQVASTAFRA